MKVYNQKSSTSTHGVAKQPFFGSTTHEPFFKASNKQVIQKKTEESEEFKLNEKLNAIYLKVKETEQFKLMTKKFESKNTNLDLRLTVVPNFDSPNTAATTSIDKNKVVIKFSEKYIQEASEISIVKTIHHELQHAIKNFHIKQDNYNSTNYPGIADYYKRYALDPKEKGEAERDWHHNLMAAHSRPEIIKGLKEFDTDKDGKKKYRSGKIYIPSLKKEVEYTDADFYEALSWGGLTKEDSKDNNKVIETEAWRKFKKDNPEKAEVYRYIGSNESHMFRNIQPVELAPIEVIGEKDSIK